MSSSAFFERTDASEEILGPRRRDALRASLFISAIVLLTVFNYSNLFILTKGPCGISSVIDEAPSLYGVTLDVFGMTENASSSGFEMVDADTGDRIYVVCPVNGMIPPDGVEIRAHGQLVESSIGPVLIADEISPRAIGELSFESAWSISVFRLFALFLICFILSVFLISLLTIASHVVKGLQVTMFSHAATEVTALLGLAAMLILASLSFSEHLILAYSTFFLLLSAAIMIVAAVMREMKEHWMTVFADAMPLVACSSIIVWILVSVAQGNMFIFDSVSAIIWGIVSDIDWFSVIGVIGLMTLSMLIISLRSDLEDVVIGIHQLESGRR